MPRHVVIARDPLIAAEAAQARYPPGVPVQRWRGSELNMDLAFAHLASADLFASAQAYHYVDFLDIKLRKAEGERLRQILERVPAEVTLICSQVFDDMSRSDEQRVMRGADYQRFAEGGKLDDRRGVSDTQQASAWLADRARGLGLALTAPQVGRLLLASGERLCLAAGELDKLAMLKTSDKPQPIPDGVFDATVSMSPAAQFYELADAVLAGSPDAQGRLAQWFDAEPETFRLLSELRRRILGLRALADGRAVQPPFFARQLAGFRRRWTAQRLRAATENLAEMEFKLKSGLIPGETSKDAELAALQVLVSQLAA